MKLSNRFDRYKAESDPTSAYLASFRFDAEYFTNWPQQDHKTLSNLVGTRVKLILQERGLSEIAFGETRLRVQSGDCVFVPPYAIYSAVTHEGVNSYELFFNIYPYAREQEFLGQFGLTQILHLPALLTPEDFRALHACYNDVQARREGSYDQLNAVLALMLLRILRARHVAAPAARVSRKEQTVIDKLFAYLDAHLAESVRVEDLCTWLHVSQSYLYRCSRSVMNCSPTQLIVRYKMRCAQTLLKNPDLTIGEIAAAVGYDPYYFSRQFKKHCLLSPSAYRKSLR